MPISFIPDFARDCNVLSELLSDEIQKSIKRRDEEQKLEEKLKRTRWLRKVKLLNK